MTPSASVISNEEACFYDKRSTDVTCQDEPDKLPTQVILLAKQDWCSAHAGSQHHYTHGGMKARGIDGLKVDPLMEANGNAYLNRITLHLDFVGLAGNCDGADCADEHAERCMCFYKACMGWHDRDQSPGHAVSTGRCMVLAACPSCMAGAGLHSL